VIKSANNAIVASYGWVDTLSICSSTNYHVWKHTIISLEAGKTVGMILAYIVRRVTQKKTKGVYSNNYSINMKRPW